MITLKTSVGIATAALSLVLLFIFSTDSLHAQQRGRGRSGPPGGMGGAGPGGGPPRMMLPPEFDNKPFDNTVAQLPPQYLGCDPELVYTRIRNGIESSRRGEIAAISKPQDRSERSPLLPVPPSLDLQSIYAFRVNYPERHYDSRYMTLKVYCSFSTVLKDGKEDASRKALRVKYIPRVDNRHIGTNDSGQKVEFEELKFREYLIAFSNYGELPVEKVELPSAIEPAEKKNAKAASSAGATEILKVEAVVGSLFVPPAEAPQVEERVAVLAVCKLVNPYVTSATVQQLPTPEKPRDYLAQYYYLDVRLMELWFYNFDTGKVLLKVTADHVN